MLVTAKKIKVIKRFQVVVQIAKKIGSQYLKYERLGDENQQVQQGLDQSTATCGCHTTPLVVERLSMDRESSSHDSRRADLPKPTRVLRGCR